MTSQHEGAPPGAPALDPTPLDVERLELEADQAWRTLRAVIESNAVFQEAWKAYSAANDRVYEAKRAVREKGM